MGGIHTRSGLRTSRERKFTHNTASTSSSRACVESLSVEAHPAISTKQNRVSHRGGMNNAGPCSKRSGGGTTAGEFNRTSHGQGGFQSRAITEGFPTARSGVSNTISRKSTFRDHASHNGVADERSRGSGIHRGSGQQQRRGSRTSVEPHARWAKSILVSLEVTTEVSFEQDVF